ncbi:MAG TPA: D-arabinono-1,4-lactone oxidase [Streptosporangiaceae bacterium]
MNAEPAARQRTNWAGNIAFAAADLYRPATLGQLQAVVARARQIRVLATGHSFNDLADSPGAQVSLAGLPPEVEIDSAASVARVAAGMTYAELAGRLDANGFALRNLASLPHISVAGACATATHGSGIANRNLAAAVTALTLVTATGDLVEIDRADDAFDGHVVHLGALGVVARLTLELIPTFDVAQRVYENLPLEALDDHFTTLMTSAYSVSLVTDWRSPHLTQLWLKQALNPPTPSTLSTRSTPSTPSTPSAPSAPFVSSVTQEPWFTATPAPAPRNPVPGLPADRCTEQLGIPGRWYDRLPHFRPEFRPSVGDELQSEYLLPVEHAVPALHALNQIRARIAPVLRICEIRVIAADQLWLSPCYRRDSVAFHFTWIADTAWVLPVVTLLECQLAPFAPRPHWGKIFTTPSDTLRSAYQRLPDFLALTRRFDPTNKFRNAYTTRCLPS